MKINTINDILNTPVQDLILWYKTEIYKPVPKASDITLIGKEIGDQLAEYGNYYNYFDSMFTMLEAMVKEMKLEKKEIDLCKKIMIKRDIIEHFAKEMKFSYDALSRICTIIIEGNREIQMLKHQ